MFSLENLLQSQAPELLQQRILLVRHQLKGDKDILKERRISEHRSYAPLDQAQKLQNLRMDMRLVEAFSSEYDSEKLGDATVVFAFGPSANGGETAEFLGAFHVDGRLSYRNWSEKYADYLEVASTAEIRNIRKSILQGLGLTADPCREGHVYYNLRPVTHSEINELRRRLVIHWKPRNPRMWAWKETTQEVLEIRPASFLKDWTGFHDVNLNFKELSELFESAKKSGENTWKNNLRHSSGVYAILNKKNGKLYIGSAYGSGFWGRWEGYGKPPYTNGNKGLEQLFRDEGEAIRDYLQISILRAMDGTSKTKDVLKAESLLKVKLGSRQHGYNQN